MESLHASTAIVLISALKVIEKNNNSDIYSIEIYRIIQSTRCKVFYSKTAISGTCQEKNICDIDSGISYHKKGLRRLLGELITGKINRWRSRINMQYFFLARK